MAFLDLPWSISHDREKEWARSPTLRNHCRAPLSNQVCGIVRRIPDSLHVSSRISSIGDFIRSRLTGTHSVTAPISNGIFIAPSKDVDGQWKGAFMETKNLVTPGQRKDEVEITLRYLENQRQEMEDNLRWVSKAAYHSRVAFLEEVAGWYRDELAQFISSTTDTECSSSDQNS